MIRIHHLSHHYGPKRVLLDIDLTIPAGELLAVMGPNGAGKSTLLGAVAGLFLPSAGYVEVDGKRRRAGEEDEMAIRQKMAYLPASPYLPMKATVRGWLYDMGRVYGVATPRLIGHIDRLLELFHLTDHADTLIDACSTGQQKKTTLCGVLVTDADYLVLDEPFTGGLDPSAIRALERILQHHAEREDKTVLVSSQIPELVESIADRVAVIHGHTLAAVGTLDALRAQSGCPGPLSEVFERLTEPDTDAEVARYFEQGGAV